ncbi:hypothetical protein RR46_04521 [Papilio xuthus]|uniref:Uncharacterized protein n=1 Tax=Papilio xuthus TaxID=66420 RepID=A0A194PN85_PAPXU|nr:hypothetical protein RR46_04521 [Papilio xuthus]
MSYSNYAVTSGVTRSNTRPGLRDPVGLCGGITLLQDAGTSDDSGRASERLTGSSLAPRDPDSSRDRLSDASSRCSSGKGYICDSEGDDDKASTINIIPQPALPTVFPAIFT